MTTFLEYGKMYNRNPLPPSLQQQQQPPPAADAESIWNEHRVPIVFIIVVLSLTLGFALVLLLWKRLEKYCTAAAASGGRGVKGLNRERVAVVAISAGVGEDDGETESSLYTVEFDEGRRGHQRTKDGRSRSLVATATGDGDRIDAKRSMTRRWLVKFGSILSGLRPGGKAAALAGGGGGNSGGYGEEEEEEGKDKLVTWKEMPVINTAVVSVAVLPEVADALG
jgi:hypothetical protein